MRGAVVILAIASIVAGCGDTTPTPSPSAATSRPTPAASTGPDASPTTNPAPTPTPPPEAAWSAVVLPDKTPVATLEPTRAGAGGVATSTQFRLTSLDGTAPADLASRLRVEPAVKLAVASTNGATAILRPASALRPATLYRVSLLGADGAIEASWAAQTAGPLHIVESIPGDAATGVPLDAGIELIFDQAGVRADDLRAHLRIEPATDGRLEAAGRSIAFVPAKPLLRATLYTVTVTRGLPIVGTGQRLEADVRIRFETRARATSRVAVGLRRSFVEATPRERAAMALWFESEEDADPPTRVPVTVHRLGGMQAAEAAWRAVNEAPTWARADVRPAVPTSGLPKVVDARLPVRDGDLGQWLLLPRPLAQGWYVVTVSWAGIPRQAVLQVTDLAVYALVTTTRSTVWVNDLKSARPVVGASVDLVGRSLGATNASGLVIGPTPAAARALGTGTVPRRVLMEIRAGGRTSFEPIATNDGLCGKCESSRSDDDLWRVVTSDRYRYRSTDTVNAWGVVRDRDTSAVPSSLRVSLLTDAGDDTALPISTSTVKPDAVGAFAVAVPLQALPAGSYRLRVEAGRASVGELWFDVGTITKPAYRLTIEPDRRAVTSGESVSVALHGSFFEGTPVAGTRIELVPEAGRGTKVTTDAEGDATGSVRLDMPYEEQWTVQSIEATPTLPEEAEIGASTTVAVFRGNHLVDVAGTVAGGRIRVTGKVTNVAFDRFEAAEGGLWSVDPHGAPLPGAAVQLRIEEHWAVRKQVGSTYDFVLKRVVPAYESEERSRVVVEDGVTTGPDGTFRYAHAIQANRSYRITATYQDTGTQLVAEAWAYDATTSDEGVVPWLVAPGSDEDERAYGVGDPIRLRFTGGTARPRVERYLFAVLQRGLRSVDIQSSPAFRATFTAADIPGFEVQGVRFTGHGYEAAWGHGVRYRVEDRRLDIRVTADRSRYAPGDTAKLTIRTLDRSGRPVAASVFVQAVDEKLFASGYAEAIDPLDMLYAGVGTGLLATVRSHKTPGDDQYGEGGDTAGGGGDDGPRGDFRDWLLGRLVRTDARGTATLAVPLSDDLTSWHVTAEGVDGSLRAGAGELVLPVGLPFFVEATIPATFVAADQPAIRVRAFGGDLHDGDRVSFTVQSATLGMAPVTVTGTAFKAVEVPLGALSVGSHVIRVQGSARGGALHDALDRTVEVLASRAARDATTWEPLDGPTPVAAGGGFTRLVLVDAGRGRVVPLLQELASEGGARCDQALAAGLASRVLDEDFGLPTTPGDELALRPFLGQDEGLAIVPYGSMNLEVTALAAMSGDPRLNSATLRSPLWAVVNDPDAKRARRLLALAGLAGLGDPVLQDVRSAAAQPNLTVEEQVNLALAAFFAGDEDLARTIEHRLLRDHGQHLGPWTRLAVATPEASIVLTARLAIVAASLGEPVAAEMDAWLAEHPPARTTVVLERALAARGWAARVPGAAARAAVVVDGTRHELDVLPDAAATLTLTPAQAAGATVEPVSGQVLVVTTRSVALDPSSLTTARGQTLTRTVTPGMRIGETDTVIVTFRVTLGPDARDECWRLTDVVPSGLAPIHGRTYDDEGVATGPTWVDGQRVEFCVQQGKHQPRVQVLRYVARVVDPGTYAWEPAVLQSSVVPDQGVATPAGTLVISAFGA